MPTSIGSGLGSSVGFAASTTYGGHAGTTTRWLPVTDAKIALNPNFQQGSGLRQGSMVHDEYERVWQAADAGGTIETSIFQNNMNWLWGGLMGGLTVTPTATGTTGQTWSFPLASSVGQFYQINLGIPDTTGVLHLWNVPGVKVTELALQAEVGSLPSATWTIDAQDKLSVGTTLSAATLGTSNQVYGFPQLSVAVGPLGSEAMLDGIEKVSLNLKKSLNSARYTTLGITSAAAGYSVKDEPIENGFFDFSGTFDTEYIDTTKFVDIFMSQTNFSVIMKFTGGVIPSSSPATNYSVTIAMPCCRYTGGDPTVDGPDIIKPSMPFMVLNDEVHPPVTITVVNTDSAL